MLTKSNMATWNKGSWVALPTGDWDWQQLIAPSANMIEHVHASN